MNLKILIAISLLGLTGCSFVPQYTRPDAPIDRHWPAGAAPSQESSDQAASELSWRQVFKDDMLKTVVALSLENNRDLRVALLNVEQLQAQYRVQRAALYPQINAGGSFTRSRTAVAVPGAVTPGQTIATTSSIQGYTSNEYALNVGVTSYEVDFFGRIRSLTSQALEKYLSTIEAHRSSQISIVSQVATQYLTLRQVQEQLRLARQTLAAVQESYDLNKANFDAGAATELDLRTAEAQVHTARVNVINYERQVAQAINDLVLLVGAAVPRQLSEPKALNDRAIMEDIPAGLPSSLLERRPDILQQEHTLKAANANIGAARAAFFPTVTLTGSAGNASAGLNQLFSTSTYAWTFAPQISVPIFNGGANVANLDVAKVSKRIEIANYEKAIQTAFREVANALVARQSYDEQLAAQKSLVDADQKRYEIANVRYRGGTDTYLNVLSAQQDLYAAQQNLIQIRFNRLSNLIALYKALGGGWK